MMSKRILLFVAMVATMISLTNARGPLSRLLGTRRATLQQSNNIHSLAPQVLLSPKKMTELYGPSILVGNVAQKPSDLKTRDSNTSLLKSSDSKTNDSRFVTQPE